MSTIRGIACAWLAMAWLGAETAVPYRMAAGMNREVERLERWSAGSRMRNQVLRRQTAKLATDDGMEREARKLGYVRKGEVPL